MFGIGLPELIVIMAVALIVVGPEKLPDLAKTIAKQVLELKKAAGSLKESLAEDEEDVIDVEEFSPERLAAIAREKNESPLEPSSPEQEGEQDTDKENSTLNEDNVSS